MNKICSQKIAETILYCNSNMASIISNMKKMSSALKFSKHNLDVAKIENVNNNLDSNSDILYQLEEIDEFLKDYCAIVEADLKNINSCKNTLWKEIKDKKIRNIAK